MTANETAAKVNGASGPDSSEAFLELFELVEKHGLRSQEVEQYKAAHADDVELVNVLQAATELESRVAAAPTVALASPAPRPLLGMVAALAAAVVVMIGFGMIGATVVQQVRLESTGRAAALEQKLEQVAATTQAAVDPKRIDRLVTVAVIEYDRRRHLPATGDPKNPVVTLTPAQLSDVVAQATEQRLANERQWQTARWDELKKEIGALKAVASSWQTYPKNGDSLVIHTDDPGGWAKALKGMMLMSNDPTKNGTPPKGF